MVVVVGLVVDIADSLSTHSYWLRHALRHCWYVPIYPQNPLDPLPDILSLSSLANLQGPLNPLPRVPGYLAMVEKC